MRSHRAGVSLTAVTLALVSVVGGAGCNGAGAAQSASSASTRPSAIGPAAQPVSLTARLSGISGQDPELATLSVATGKVLRRLSGLPGGAQVTGPFAAGDGSLWYTLSSGPRSRSDVLGGDPAPDSCTSKVIRLDPKTGASRTVLASSSSALIGAAVPNPAGTEVAYLRQGCQDYKGWYLVVRNLKTGTEHSIGRADAPCDDLSTPSWSADGKSLIFTWAPALEKITRPGPQSACPGSPVPDNAIVVVPARYRGPVPTGQAVADQGCGYVAASFDRWGVAAVDVCGLLSAGTTTLVQLSRSLHSERGLPLPASADGVSVSTAPGGAEVAVDEYQAPGFTANPPAQWLEIYDGMTLRTIVHASMGELWPVSTTW